MSSATTKGFLNDTATTEIYTLSLHDALPICRPARAARRGRGPPRAHEAQRARAQLHGDLPGLRGSRPGAPDAAGHRRSEEHTSELQSRQYLVCRLLLERTKNQRPLAAPPVLS